MSGKIGDVRTEERGKCGKVILDSVSLLVTQILLAIKVTGHMEEICTSDLNNIGNVGRYSWRHSVEGPSNE